MSEREKVDTYTIPPNFAESGKWFSGRVSAGNVVEAAVMSLILLKILLQIPVEGKAKIYLGSTLRYVIEMAGNNDFEVDLHTKDEGRAVEGDMIYLELDENGLILVER